MKYFALIIALFVSYNLSFGQNSMSFHYVHAVPQGEYKDNLMHQPSGIAFEFMHGLKKIKNLQVGGAFNVSMYQNEDFEGTVDVSEFNSTYVETNEDDCYYTYQGIARYFLSNENSLIRPYVQAQAGGTTFFSTLTVEQDLSLIHI